MSEKLFLNGKLPKGPSVAIIGTRNPSERGKKLAYDFAYFLAQKGIVVVSGLARGIDTIAHKAALDAGGITVAVLGSGLDIIYPPENKSLAEEIVKSGGAVVSPYPHGTPPRAENFKPRNSVVVGLSRAVIVIEAMARSGTINTAGWAGDMGVEVFSCPGSPATDYLIGNGATVCVSPIDVLDYLVSLE